MTQTHRELDGARKYERLIAEAWVDSELKRLLLADPAAVLRERGFDLPAGAQVRVVEDTDQLTHLILPMQPREAEISAEQLRQVTGGLRNEVGPKLPPYL